VPCENELVLAIYPHNQSSPAPFPLGWRPPCSMFRNRAVLRKQGSYEVVLTKIGNGLQ